MTTKTGGTWFSQRSYFSEGDKWSVRFLYGPPHATLKREDHISYINGNTHYREDGYVNYYLDFGTPTQYDRSIVYSKTKQEIKNGNYVTTLIGTYSVYVPSGTTKMYIGG